MTSPDPLAPLQTQLAAIDPAATAEATKVDVLDRIEFDLARLDEELPALPDELLLVRGRLEEAMRRGRELKQVMDAVLKRWLQANGGKLEFGDWKYVVGPDKNEKPRNFKQTVDATLGGCGGDIDAFVDCLSINALKPGAVRKVLGDKFDFYFETTYGTELKVQALNTKFLKG